MPSSAALRIKIETDLQQRYPSALTPAPRTIREVVATCIPAIDELLDGGLPVGAISELTGPASSGRTTIALAFLASLTHDDRVCAWVDAGDALDPESAAANGVSLRHLLWIRCADAPGEKRFSALRNGFQKKSQPWSRLDKAIRATDLLLQAGGFGAIVLDLADEAIEHGRRIPLATWFRFRQAADRTRCSLVVLGRASYAQSSAALVLECRPDSVDEFSPNIIRRFAFNAQRGRERFTPVTTVNRIQDISRWGGKPPMSAWSAQASWDCEKRA
jgi:hypothetical protein